MSSGLNLVAQVASDENSSITDDAQGWLQFNCQRLLENSQLSNEIESEVKIPINIAINLIAIAINIGRAIPEAITTHLL